MSHLWLIILSVGGDVLINNESFLVTYFVNLKINPIQSFRYAHRGRVYVCVHKSKCSYVYEYLRFNRVFRKLHYGADSIVPISVLVQE
jgi:hypothetical protein